MNRLVLGILLGVAFGVVDVLMTLRGNHPTEGISGDTIPSHSRLSWKTTARFFDTWNAASATVLLWPSRTALAA